MLQGVIIRGTTPVHDFELPYPKELIKDLRITYGQNNRAVVTKSLKDCVVSAIDNSINSKLSTQLTQEETLMFLPQKNVSIEMRVWMTDNNVIRNEEAIELRVVDTINEEVFK